MSKEEFDLIYPHMPCYDYKTMNLIHITKKAIRKIKKDGKI